MAGNGQRFKDAGYTVPKPFIEFNGKSMIGHVISSLGQFVHDSKFIYICKKEHLDEYHIEKHVSELTPNYRIITVDHTTEGAACTSLLAKDLINNDKELIIANSDQIVLMDAVYAIRVWQERKADGGIFLFKANDKKWSFAKCTDDYQVLEVAEKNPISNLATCGIYWYNKGSEYVKYATQMIHSNIRVNNEFYICPVYNEYIKDNKKIYGSLVSKMDGVGTPEDLQTYLYKIALGVN